MKAKDFNPLDTGRFTAKSAGVQWATLVTIITVLTGGLGAAVLWAADARIDEKYATDEDLRAVQETTSQQFKAIGESVTKNTETLQRTAGSVDGLALVVLDLQIEKIENAIIDLEDEKQDAGSAWGTRDEQELRAKEKALSNLRLQRDKLFERILADQ